MSTQIPEPAIPRGSLVLVTGASGYIASHMVSQLLQLGYNVRGTVRSIEKAKASSAMYAPFETPSSKYETVIVADLASEGAFNAAVKGCAGVIHTATITSFSPNPHDVIPQTVAGATNAFKAAVGEPSVKRFVFTSSSTAAAMPEPGKEFVLDRDTWNDECSKMAWAPPPYDYSRAYTVYGASKYEAERAMWSAVESHDRTDLVFNAILPDANLGKILDGGSAGATGTWVVDVFNKQMDKVAWTPPQWYVDVTDDARVHVAALIDPTVQNERIYAFAEPYNWNDIIDSVERARPGWHLDHLEGQGRDLSKPDNALGAELLKKWFNQDGYTTLDESVRANLEVCV